MKEGEVLDISNRYPLLPTVLRMIDQGQSISSDDPFFETYLLARQRGFVTRKGSDGTVVVSPRGKEFLQRREIRVSI